MGGESHSRPANDSRRGKQATVQLACLHAARWHCGFRVQLPAANR